MTSLAAVIMGTSGMRNKYKQSVVCYELYVLGHSPWRFITSTDGSSVNMLTSTSHILPLVSM